MFILALAMLLNTAISMHTIGVNRIPHISIADAAEYLSRSTLASSSLGSEFINRLGRSTSWLILGMSF
ncbi:hypothetical protein SAMN03159341_10986 [Paenibacillus sp. 1_12]|nr:hypothetical protein SAMN03159341_10986 [Paenibacillus sp. 1_12]